MLNFVKAENVNIKLRKMIIKQQNGNGNNMLLNIKNRNRILNLLTGFLIIFQKKSKIK